MRCFIGILIPENIRKNIKNFQDELKKLPMDCKFVEEENLHICLSFLGEVEESRLEGISNALDSICEKKERFEVSISGLKLIPSEKYVRVIALDVLDEKIKKLSEEIVKRIGGEAKPPHLTLCRVKKIKDKQKFLEGIEKYKKIEVCKLFVSSVQLIKSTLQKTGPIYTSIHESKLIKTL